MFIKFPNNWHDIINEVFGRSTTDHSASGRVLVSLLEIGALREPPEDKKILLCDVHLKPPMINNGITERFCEDVRYDKVGKVSCILCSYTKDEK
jgi:hypothetical protein